MEDGGGRTESECMRDMGGFLRSSRRGSGGRVVGSQKSIQRLHDAWGE